MDWEYPLYLAARTFPGWLDLVAGKLRDIWAFFLGAALSLPLIIAPQVWRNRRVRLLLVCCLMVLAGSSLVWWSTPHYFAPAACALYALVLQSLRYLRSQGRRSAGLVLAWGIPVLCVLTIPLQPAVRQLAGDVQIHSFADWWTVNHQMLERLEVARRVQTAAKKNLIIVRYSSKHNSLNEWVYNRANIDSAPIVWAHDMDPAKNRELIDYFKDRKVWLLEPDFDQPRLTPYPSE